MYPVIRLEAAGLETLDLDIDHGFIGKKLDLGDAVTRDVADDAPDADGTDDTTALIGARNVGLELVVDASFDIWQLEQRLRAFTHPRLRPEMYLQRSATAPEQRVTLRRSQFSNPIVDDQDLTISVQWVAPNGIVESAELHEAIASASGGGAEGGRTYDRTGDRVYSAGTVVGAVTVTNAGTADAYPLLRIYGPCTDPVVENVTQDKALVFDGLTINAGEFLEVDTRAMTIYYQGDPADSRYDDLDFPASAWWTLSPGDNTVRLNPATYSIPSQLVIEYRDAWL